MADDPPVLEAPAPEAERPMGLVYATVLLVEVVTLLGLWWFQTALG